MTSRARHIFRGEVFESDESEEPFWTDEDVVAVRRVFRAISDEVRSSKRRLQVIVLDHADNDVWGEVERVSLVENWRDGKKLVPEGWL